MNTLSKTLAACGLVVASAGPMFAESHIVDPMTMSCADYSAMESDAMMMATHQMDTAMAMTDEEMTAAMAMTDEEKATKTAEMDAAMAAMTDDEKAAAATATEASMAKMMEACKAMPDGTVMDAAKAAM
jgi:hypothetical protein